MQSEISDLLKSGVDYDQSTLDVNALLMRADYIKRLHGSLEALQQAAAAVAERLAVVTKTHECDVETIRKIFQQMDGPTMLSRDSALTPAVVSTQQTSSEATNDSSWVKVVRKRQRDTCAVSVDTAPVVGDTTTVVNPTPEVIRLTDALSLYAIKVPTFDYVRQDGNLYYVVSADHFAFRLAGTMFHGNIGTIYTDERNPEKIKDCRFTATCMKRDKCDYYHDPIKFRGSRDRRNFVASSWMYTPPSHPRMRNRKVGSREHLETDIADLNPNDISRYSDQVTHDILCALVIDRAFSSN